jgi:hypothetical protein
VKFGFRRVGFTALPTSLQVSIEWNRIKSDPSIHIRIPQPRNDDFPILAIRRVAF